MSAAPKDATRYLPWIAPFVAAAGIPQPAFEVRFREGRQWRLDVAWPEAKVALEINGGIWTGGRHTRGTVLKDYEKLNAAQRDGWVVLQCAPPPKKLPARTGVHIPPYLTEPSLWADLITLIRTRS